MARYQPALLGGLFISLAAPLVGSLIRPSDFDRTGTVAWVVVVVLGGMMAVALRQQQLPHPIKAAAAIAYGFCAGAGAGVAVTLVTRLLAGGVDQAQIDRAIGDALSGTNVSPDQMETIRFMTSEPIATIFGLALAVILYGTLGILGALLGTAFFRNRTATSGVGGPAA